MKGTVVDGLISIGFDCVVPIRNLTEYEAGRERPDYDYEAIQEIMFYLQDCDVSVSSMEPTSAGHLEIHLRYVVPQQIPGMIEDLTKHLALYEPPGGKR